MTGPVEYAGTIDPPIVGPVEIAADAVMADTLVRALVNPHRGWCFADHADVTGGAHVEAHREVLEVHPCGLMSFGTILVAFTADEWTAMRDALQAMEGVA